jgi:pimeloyl-ACP methyl ester carboxylesterase
VETIAGIEVPDSQWVDVGGPVHYRRWPGPPEEPAFVCVHGLGGSHLNWAGVAPGLARHGPVLALDLGGFGLTPPGERGTGVGANRKLLDGFLRALDLEPAVLVGNSMGGMISLIQAAHAPATARSLVLVDAAFPRAHRVRAQPAPRIAAMFALYSSRLLGERLVASRARRLGPERLVRETFKFVAADPSRIDPALVEAHIEMARRRQGFDYAALAFIDAARSIFRSQVAPARYRELVRQVRTPALVIHGTRDTLIEPAAAREAVDGHANWELVVLDGVGHVPMLEAPDRWLAAVEAWLTDRTERTAG